MKKYIQWVITWPASIALALGARIFFSWWVTCFVVRTMKTDTVKRLGKITATIPRDNLIPLFWGFNTHDNNTDEWWYGVYNTSSFWFAKNWTQEQYDASKYIRWFCRVMWLWRNSAYGFNYAWFSKPKEEVIKQYVYGKEDIGLWYDFRTYKNSFQLEAHIPLGFGYYNSINIGWKEHKGKDRKLFAGRILGIRKY